MQLRTLGRWRFIALALLSTVSLLADETSADSSKGKFIAYYFHTTARCATCLKIEDEARSVIETDFADQLRSERLVWKVVDVEVPENSHFVQDFQLLTKSLVLVEQEDGRPKRFKVLDKVWELVWSPDRYRDYVRGELRTFLGTR